mmetsp:Transcript_24584/g.72360  ORF Transcript_24584/g.72360 Transcript_24584/m.72360 type:complete len:336 (+) Transcript_24584:386-1393(+)
MEDGRMRRCDGCWHLRPAQHLSLKGAPGLSLDDTAVCKRAAPRRCARRAPAAHSAGAQGAYALHRSRHRRDPARRWAALHARVSDLRRAVGRPQGLAQGHALPLARPRRPQLVLRPGRKRDKHGGARAARPRHAPPRRVGGVARGAERVRPERQGRSGQGRQALPVPHLAADARLRLARQRLRPAGRGRHGALHRPRERREQAADGPLPGERRDAAHHRPRHCDRARRLSLDDAARLVQLSRAHRPAPRPHARALRLRRAALVQDDPPDPPRLWQRRPRKLHLRACFGPPRGRGGRRGRRATDGRELDALPRPTGHPAADARLLVPPHRRGRRGP